MLQMSTFAPEIAKYETMPVPSESRATRTYLDVGAATSTLQTLQQDGAAILDAAIIPSSTNNSTNDFLDLPSNMDNAALAQIHPISEGGYSDRMWHQLPSSPTKVATYVGDHGNILPQEPHDNSAAPANVLQGLTGCHPAAGQDVPFNGYTADSQWSGVFGTTWNSNLGQGGGFKEMIDQRRTGSFGPIYNSDLSLGLPSHCQTANQQWSGIFGLGWHPCLDVLPNGPQRKSTFGRSNVSL